MTDLANRTTQSALQSFALLYTAFGLAAVELIDLYTNPKQILFGSL